MSEEKKTGLILKALSGFYYVRCGEELLACRARGKFRYQKITPLVGDQAECADHGDGTGTLTRILPRKNEFRRPAVANIDQLVIIASGAVPVTDPFLIDRVISIAEGKSCEPILCINKWDLVQAEQLYDLYLRSGFQTLKVSAATGEGIEALRQLIAGKVSAFTGNSGVGKSSILNALEPEFGIPVGEVSSKLGRGRHTTRHVELFPLKNGALVADTPGFSAFDEEQMELQTKEELQNTFREFRPYLSQCQFVGCSHVKEKGCAVLEAMRAGKIMPSRHNSYVRLYEQIKQIPDWERNHTKK